MVFRREVRFFTNRIWVFPSNEERKKSIWEQMLLFYSGGVVMLLIREILLYVLTIWVVWPGIVAKVVACLISC